MAGERLAPTFVTLAQPEWRSERASKGDREQRLRPGRAARARGSQGGSELWPRGRRFGFGCGPSCGTATIIGTFVPISIAWVARSSRLEERSPRDAASHRV